MHPRARQLIDELGLQPHPEGGHYREVFRSDLATARARDGVARVALTAIYFLLARGERSRWHQVSADEAWHHCEGAPLRLLSFPPGGGPGRLTLLGPVAAGSAPLHVVPTDHWQAAQSLGDFTLVACSVGPGFDFADFRLLADLPAASAPAPEGLPDHRDFL
jgi:predicted cupin superfamily sugar epimerase